MSILLLAWLLTWVSGAVRALVFMKGWEWFVADTFGSQELGFVQSWGLVLILTLVTAHLANKDDKRMTVETTVLATVSSLILSGIYFSLLIVLVGFR